MIELSYGGQCKHVAHRCSSTQRVPTPTSYNEGQFMAVEPNDEGCARALAHRDDLAQLRVQFPGWRFGTVWATAATGPDRRRVWARNGDILLSAWDAASLRAAISAELGRGGDDGAAP
jgi:hypothetical protein